MVPGKEFHDAVSQELAERRESDVPAAPPDSSDTDRRENRCGKRHIPVAVERRDGKDRRKERGERRRGIDPTTCERNYNEDEIEFMKAMDQYRRGSLRAFPTWSEALEVLRALGYRKVAEPTQMPGLPPPCRRK